MAWSCLGEHPNIVALLTAYEEETVHYFVMERCVKSLRELSKSKPDLSCEEHTFSMFAQTLLGLQHCHNKNIVHRDVKPSNILVDVAGNIRLCDFGVAVAMPEDESLLEVVGTTPYMSPEMVKRRGYDFKTDIWSFGVTVYAYIYGDYPYRPGNKKVSEDPDDETLASAKKAMLVAIASNNPEPRYKTRGSSHPSAQAKRFVEATLQRHAEDRPDVNECLQMEIIQKDEKKGEKISFASTTASRKTQSTVAVDTEKGTTEVSFDVEEGLGTDASLVLSENMSKFSTTASPAATIHLGQEDSFLRQLAESTLSRSQGNFASSPSQSATLKSLTSNRSQRA
jgi:serine/threonine protein kinase